MTKKILKNKPLLEAIFEFRWGFQDNSSGISLDPNYKIIVGRLYDRLNIDYPYYEQLLTANIPDEIATYIVQHRFRKDKDKWPLIQVGPGIITVNDTEEYTWEDFEKRIQKVLNIFFEVYPESKFNLKIYNMLLRYVNAIKFDFENENILDFLKRKLKTNITFSQSLFINKKVKEFPKYLDLKSSFILERPIGLCHLRFVTGKIKEDNSLIFEIGIENNNEEIFNDLNKIFDWIKESHDLIEEWFFKLIEGDLLKGFE